MTQQSVHSLLRNSFDDHPRPSECVPMRCLGRAMQKKIGVYIFLPDVEASECARLVAKGP